MKNLQLLSKKDQIGLLNAVSIRTGLLETAIEKDWWVTMVLKALFDASCKGHLFFKGGTSLSKAWHLIDRFSEDIDLSISPVFFNIAGTNKSQLDKLRKESRRYVHNVLSAELEGNLNAMGVRNFEIENVTTFISGDGARTLDSDKDPTVILLHYDSVLGDRIKYIQPTVKIEVSCLSMDEPVKRTLLTSFIRDYYPEYDETAIADAATVLPERTFLEKMFLLNEEFQKEHPRCVRMSRHWYDLERMMDTSYGLSALNDTELYMKIVRHRKTHYALKYVDYQRNSPSLMNLCPPASIFDDWRDDYESMRQSFIYGKSLTFEELQSRIVELQRRLRAIPLPVIEF